MKYHRPSPVQRLDPTSQAKWEERLEDPAFVNLIPTCASMASFMNQRCRTLETIDLIWQTMRRAIWWEVTEYPMRVYQHLLPRILTLGFVYSVMMRGIPFLIVTILKPCLLPIGFKKRNGSVFA